MEQKVFYTVVGFSAGAAGNFEGVGESLDFLDLAWTILTIPNDRAPVNINAMNIKKILFWIGDNLSSILLTLCGSK